MNELDRLQNLFDYQILDTPPEKELDDLARIASLACNTPISLITFIDSERQWFKAKNGLTINETNRKDSFCQHALNTPEEILIVGDSFKDDRFKDSALVKGDPNIRFYAGAPLVTPEGHVLGTLCVIDNKPRKITKQQIEILRILSAKAINYLNTRKLLLEQKKNIETNIDNIKKLTDLAPCVIYQFRMTEQGEMDWEFVSKGISELHPDLSPEILRKNPELAFNHIHPEDLPTLTKSIKNSFDNLTDWVIEYRVVHEHYTSWHLGKAKPEKMENNDVVWYGTFQDITPQKEYEEAMEQVAFDISHVLRRPVASLVGLSDLIASADANDEDFKEYSKYIQLVSQELDTFSRKLDVYYSLKRDKIERSKLSYSLSN